MNERTPQTTGQPTLHVLSEGIAASLTLEADRDLVCSSAAGAQREQPATNWQQIAPLA